MFLLRCLHSCQRHERNDTTQPLPSFPVPFFKSYEIKLEICQYDIKPITTSYVGIPKLKVEKDNLYKPEALLNTEALLCTCTSFAISHVWCQGRFYYHATETSNYVKMLTHFQ